MKNINKLGIFIFGLFFSFAVKATPISQVDLVTMTGPTYRNDIWTLSISTPVASTVSYTAVPDDELGANLQNVTTNWVAAINADPILSSFITAEIIPFIPASSFTQFTLTAITAGVPFLATVSVFEDCDCNNNESEPITVDIQTITAASVPEPSTLPLLAFGVGIISLYRKNKLNLNNA